MITGNNR